MPLSHTGKPHLPYHTPLKCFKMEPFHCHVKNLSTYLCVVLSSIRPFTAFPFLITSPPSSHPHSYALFHYSLFQLNSCYCKIVRIASQIYVSLLKNYRHHFLAHSLTINFLYFIIIDKVTIKAVTKKE